MGLFHASTLKVKRANQHIKELIDLFGSFASDPELYSIFIDKPERWHANDELVITIHKSQDELGNEAALIIGDVYHNLRSALDILWFEIVSPTGLATKWTRFPVLDTREQLIGTKLDPALEKRQITEAVHEFMRDTIKPYRAGDFWLWIAEEANLIDKHQLLTPNFWMTRITGVRVQNDEEIINLPPIITESTCRFSARDLRIGSFGKNPKVIDKGHATLAHGFGMGHPNKGEPVVPALNAVAKEVARTIDAFALLLS